MFKIKPSNANLVCTVVVAGINLSTPLKVLLVNKNFIKFEEIQRKLRSLKKG